MNEFNRHQWKANRMMHNYRNNRENAKNKWHVGEGPGNCPYNSWVAAGPESLAVLWCKTCGRSIHSMPRLCRQGCRDNAQPWTYAYLDTFGKKTLREKHRQGMLNWQMEYAKTTTPRKKNMTTAIYDTRPVNSTRGCDRRMKLGNTLAVSAWGTSSVAWTTIRALTTPKCKRKGTHEHLRHTCLRGMSKHTA